MNQSTYFVSLFHLHFFIVSHLPENLLIPSGNYSTKTGTLSSTEPNSDTAYLTDRCLQKCCQPHKVFDWENRRCVVDHQVQNSSSSELFSRFDVIIVDPDSWCPGEIRPLNGSLENTKYQLFNNGSIFVAGVLLNFRQYCMDYLTQDNNINPVVCFDDSILPSEFEFRFDHIGYVISTFFLIITLGLYTAISSLREKVHCKCVLFHTFSLIMGYSSLLVVENIDLENPVCSLSGHMLHFWVLASFFWLNIISIDMWRSIGNIGMHKESNIWKLFIYSMYAWGCPCLISIFTLLADNFFDLSINSPWRPGFAETSCWLREDSGNESWVNRVYVYYYGIISITLAVNIVLFVDIVILVRNQNKTWKQCTNADSKRHQLENTSFILYLKLFLIMGLDWVLVLLSFHCDDGTSTFCSTIDFINSFLGVFIFIIFVCNKRILTILKEQFFARNQCSKYPRKL